MLKVSCICDRCKKEFESKDARRIIFEPTLTQNETLGSKFVELVKRVFPGTPRDYCPECISEIRDFMKSKENKADKGELRNEPE